MSIISDREKKYYIYIPTESLELKPYDIRSTINAIYDDLENSTVSYGELEKVFVDLREKPYTVYRYIDRIEELVRMYRKPRGITDYFGAKINVAQRIATPMLGFIINKSLVDEGVLEKIADFIEKVKLASILDKNIEK